MKRGVVVVDRSQAVPSTSARPALLVYGHGTARVIRAEANAADVEELGVVAASNGPFVAAGRPA